MATKKKMLQAAAGQAGGEALDITDVFSTYLYEGNGYPNSNTQTITNSLDLSGEGGLTWIKKRDSGGTGTYSHLLFDTERGATKFVKSDSTDAQDTDANALTSFNSDGFSIGNKWWVNDDGGDFASWTFRKAPKFFDVVTYTGTGSSQSISHNLDCQPGMIIAKRTDSSTQGDWIVSVLDTSVGSTYYRRLYLNKTNASLTNDSATATTTTFDPNKLIGADGSYTANQSSATYVAYVFAHNDGDGGFGPDGDQDIIKCGSFPWGSTSGTEVNLGFEPQWILFKAADQEGKNWFIFDAMRGIVTGGLSGDGDAALFPNTSGAENVNTWGVDLTPTGFIAYGNNIASSGNIIYMAIRRGPLAQPESGTEVFAVGTRAGASGNVGAYSSGFPVDMAFHKVITSSINPYEIGSRLTQGKSMNTTDTSAEVTQSDQQYDYMDGWNSETSVGSTNYSWMWKRAPGFFDVVAYTGTGSAMTVSHNLGVAPEMIWVKARSVAGELWAVYHSGLNVNNDNAPETDGIWLSATNAAFDSSSLWNDTAPTETVFSLSTNGAVNTSGVNYIAYLFATLAGVSKVGSYTGNGSSQTIDCGFTSGARFVLIKRTDSTGSWVVYDTERGIVSGNDAALLLQSSGAEYSGADEIDPNSSGFDVVHDANGFLTNASGASYIFYAIA